MHDLTLFFHWPDGAVWGNLIASLLWSLPLWIVGYYKLKKHQQKRHQDLKDHIDRKFAKLTENEAQ